MTDLNNTKLWAEQLPSFKENYICLAQLEAVEFNNETGSFDALTKDATGFDLEDILEAYHSVNTGWAMWLRAKAQAVPEGYVVVPIELYNFQADRLAEEEFNQNKKLFDMEHRGLSGIEVELRKAKWLVYKAENIKQNYRQLVKWASESGAEG